MKLLSATYLKGPNLHGPASGLLAEIGSVADMDPEPDWRPDIAQAEAALKALRQALPIGVGRAFSTNAAQMVAAPSPLAAFALTIFDHVVHDSSVEPAPSRITGIRRQGVQLFAGCSEERIAEPVLTFALATARSLAAGGAQAGGLTERFRTLQTQVRADSLTPWSVALANAAFRRGVPWARVFVQGQFLRLGQGVRSWRILETASDRAGYVAGVMAADKLLVLSLLFTQSLPTPDSQLLSSVEQAVELADAIGYPLVVKPRSGAEGRGAIVNINDEAALRRALGQAASFDSAPLLERFIVGEEFSLLVVGGRLLAATRVPAGYPAYGPCSNVTDRVHAEVRVMAERAARIVGLDMAEVVYRASDIARPWRETGGAILHVKAMPSLKPHLTASPGRDFAGALVESLFPDGADGRIPTCGVTGSIGKSTTCHMVAAILTHAGKLVARSTTQGAWIGADKVVTGDVAGGATAGKLLQDPGVEAGVFELARGGLIRFGMGIDGVDVGAVLNVHDNHLGLDGVSTREELAAVKSLVVQFARKLAILNADDPLCLAMRTQITAPALGLISLDPDNPLLAEHRRAGGLTGCLHRNGLDDARTEIRLFEGEMQIGALSAADIPASLGGRFEPPLISALFAAAIAHGMGVGFDDVRAGLGQFESDFATNPWRMNFLEGPPFQLCLTWADGPAPYAALSRFAGKTTASGNKRLMFSMMGDRTDDFMLQSVAAIAAEDAFHQYVVSDWDDLRGRSAGEAADLLIGALKRGGVAEDRIVHATSHEAATDTILGQAQPGDLVIIVTPRVGGERIVRTLEARGLVPRPPS